MNRTLRLLVVTSLGALILEGCGLLGGGSNPRQDDPNVTAPTTPQGTVAWASLEWQDVTFEQPNVVSGEQWDQATAVAAGPGGLVGVGSNSDITGYIGRIWHSDDSLAWRLVDSPSLDGLELVDIAASHDTFVAIGTRSANPNDPIASILVSPDGLSWVEADSVAGSWAASVDVGPRGFAIVLQSGPGDTTRLLLSSDGASWTRMEGTEVAPDAWISDVAWADGAWLAAGSVGERAAVWRSADGTAWTEERLPASEPVEGLMDVSAYRVVPGRWATIVLGRERDRSCAEDDDWCPKFQTAWSWTAQSGWARLPKATWILNRGCCVDLYPAGAAGFLYYLGMDAMLSANGWQWTQVKESAASAVLARDVVVVGDQVVGVGVGTGNELEGWFGSAVIIR